MRQDKDKLGYEDLQESFQKLNEKLEQVKEFDIILADQQIDKLVKDGLFTRSLYKWS
ncbi:TPA: hypothetical protein TXN48_001666 [Streptococcus suis]|uniref:hypothetical protein n=1 Tax=uncultured Streptococcus sp. TaxID=83427 RepID=UPI0025E53ABD|nr:hypothetical protein [uncultured Streptococcus sp.]HEL1678355.1 hypothetical protein [Streptococcus suis]HEL1833156.1 hypothetical protein [Streptococcus suis]HEN0300906.1 hypothetical protein [Streptococcus agalactiae]